MEEKQIRLDVTLPPKLAKLHVDKDKLAATLVNLLSNATKYTPRGGEVALRTKVSEQALVIEVIDSGYGISADELPKVFDKFFRSADPRVQEESGSGLGLSLAREVARLHGGNLRVNSELDKGTTFTLTLPL
jgi:signal transduction histidine kinase